MGLYGRPQSQTVSRGFHRLGLFLAAFALLVSGIASLNIASDAASSAKWWHDEQAALVCAQEAFHRKFYADLSREDFDRRIAAKLAPIQTGEVKVTDPDLKELGCSDLPRLASVQEIFSAKPPGDFNWTTELWSNIGLGIAFAVALALSIYGIVRAIGWVIGWFAVS